MLVAEWIDYMNAYRLYDTNYPNWTIAYEDFAKDIPDEFSIIE